MIAAQLDDAQARFTAIGPGHRGEPVTGCPAWLLIATRETRVAARLRAVEHAYRMAIERNSVFSQPETTKPYCFPEHPADREIELE